MSTILDSHPQPCVAWRLPHAKKLFHPLCSLSQNLKSVLRRLLNYLKHLNEVIVRDLFVEQIAHGINKINSWSFAYDGLLEPLGKKCQTKTVFIIP